MRHPLELGASGATAQLGKTESPAKAVTAPFADSNQTQNRIQDGRRMWRRVGGPEQPHGSIRMESRMAPSSARWSGGEPGDRSAAIIRRVPSTSRIQNSSL